MSVTYIRGRKNQRDFSQRTKSTVRSESRYLEFVAEISVNC